MIDISNFCGKDFKVVTEAEKWKIGFLRYSDRFSKFTALERHLLTDEAFILLKGKAVLYIENENGVIVKYKMKKLQVYNVREKVWHHITVSKNATVMVVENQNTSKENTERRSLI